MILQRIFTPGPSTTLPQPPGRYPTHPGPILTSQLLLEGDLGPETCQNRLFRAVSRRFANFWGCPRVILQRIFTPGPITTLPQPPGRYPTHPGPILTSQLLLEGDLGPETCQNRLFRAILGPPRKTYSLVLSESTLDPYKMST